MWIAFAIVTVALAAYTTWRFYGDRRLFVPGATTAGHHQIETECFTCHTPMAGVKSDACSQCHADELERVDDSHPRGKFTDPRNADLLSKLDARECMTCHIEHRPERTLDMGVTQPSDFCAHCHADIGSERASHKDLAFATCQDAGCHNFHDNRALHVDYLEARLKLDVDPPVGQVPTETQVARAQRREGVVALTRQQADVPAGRAVDASLVDDWATTLHAQLGVNCSGCHASDATEGSGGTWRDQLDHDACAPCHEREVQGFLGSRHGMRLAAKLPAMRVADARLPMNKDAGHRELTCVSCHGSHQFDRREAAVDACLQCHADDHSRGYLQSEHYAAWKRELASGPAGSGVSCATCHLPREADMPGAAAWVRHNQNDYLRPNEKMITTVCVNCHSARESFDALADRAWIKRGTHGAPSVNVASMEMVRRKLATLDAQRGADP